jgi:hypothetical protein
MAVGPVEYMIVAFPGNEFKGEILPELAKLMETNTVRLLDLLFITKDENGGVVAVELDDEGDISAFSSVDGEIGGILSNEDISYAASALDPNSSAALLIWEDVWATPFAEACRRANGVIVQGARIPHEIVEEIMSGLPA